jgi:uncharacterized membrane protein YebE (DUF533 family)
MVDFVGMLGSMLQQGGAPAAQGRLQNVAPEGGLDGLIKQLTAGGSGAASGLGGLLSQLGGAGAAGAGGLAGTLGGLLNQATGGRSLDQIIGSASDMAKKAAADPVGQTQAMNPAAMGGLGAIAGALLGGGRGAVGGGLMAMLGTLAMSALQNAGTAAATPAAGPNLDDHAVLQHKASVLLRAMIQAAKADGQIDNQEMQRIMGKLAEGGEDAAARDFVLQEMSKPVDIAGLAALAQTPHDAAEIYAASLVAITVDSDAERDYLAKLAAALQIPPQVAAHIQATLAG